MSPTDKKIHVVFRAADSSRLGQSLSCLSDRTEKDISYGANSTVGRMLHCQATDERHAIEI